jgi:hypothetical protein
VGEPLFVGFSLSTGDLAGRELGAAIRTFEGAGPDDPNHALLIRWDQELGWITYGANANGVTDLPLEVFLQDRALTDVFAPAFDLWSGFRAHADDLGKPYDYRGLAGMAFVSIGAALGKRWGNALDNGHELFCSEWVSEVCRMARLKLLGTDDWIARADNAINPFALRNYCHKRIDCFPDPSLHFLGASTTRWEPGEIASKLTHLRAST